MENVDGLDYEKLVKFMNAQMQHRPEEGMSKDELRKLMLIAESERERQCIRYTVYKSYCVQVILCYFFGSTSKVWI